MGWFFLLTRFQKGFQVVLIQVDNCEIRHRTAQRFVVVDLIFYFKPDIALIYPLTSITLPYGGLRGWTHLKLSADKLPVFNWSQAQVQLDFFAMVTRLLFVEVTYKFINGSFAFGLG